MDYMSISASHKALLTVLSRNITSPSIPFNAPQDSLSSSVLKSLSLIDFEIVDRIAERPAAPKVSPENKLIASGYRNSPGSTPESGGGKGQVGDVMMEGLLTSIASRAALGTLLLLMHRCPSYLSKQSWKVMWMLLALLRDCSLLPASMIVLDSSGGDSDLLPAACRTEFEVRLLAADRREIDAQLRMHNRSHPPQTLVKKSSSILSLQGERDATHYPFLFLNLVAPVPSDCVQISHSLSFSVSLYASLSLPPPLSPSPLHTHL